MTLRQSLKLDAGVAERGLFSFSNNFFSNNLSPKFIQKSDDQKRYSNCKNTN